MIENQVIFQNEYNICYYEENSNNKWEIVRPMAPKEHKPLRFVYQLTVQLGLQVVHRPIQMS